MTEMYYAESPDSAHNIHELEVTLLGQPFTSLTDSDVFSKEMIDCGSQILLNTADFKKGKVLLDLGCGCGPLGISLAKVQGVRATMVDVNNQAVDLAQKNAERDGVTANIFQSSIYEKITSTSDCIISNPLTRAGKQVVYTTIADNINCLNDGGSLTIVIQKKQGAPSAKAEMEEIFGSVDVLKHDKGYYILRSTKTE